MPRVRNAWTRMTPTLFWEVGFVWVEGSLLASLTADWRCAMLGRERHRSFSPTVAPVRSSGVACFASCFFPDKIEREGCQILCYVGVDLCAHRFARYFTFSPKPRFFRGTPTQRVC